MSKVVIQPAIWRDYLALCKSRVVALMLLTAWIGMLLASPRNSFPWHAFIFGSIGIALSSGAAATFNHLVEHHIDKNMHRTHHRPVVQGRITVKEAFLFAFILGVSGLGILVYLVNPLTAWLTLGSQIGYALIYTLYLKRATHQNIVIGGLAGAAPPLLGWTAVSNSIEGYALLLVLIVYTWTPPHFWALAIYRVEDYTKTPFPMLPVTHGIPTTKICILLYTILLLITTILPYLTGMSGISYLICAIGLGLGFLYYAIKLLFTDDRKVAYATFTYSIIYLMALFLGFLFDHYLFDAVDIFI